MNELRLTAAISAVAPIDGIAILDMGQKIVRIDYKAEATHQQRTAAESALAAFDWSASADQAWEDAKNPERKDLKDQAQAALDANQTFLDLASPTNAQVVAQVRRLTQQVNRLIKRTVQLG